MATENESKQEFRESSTNQNSFLISSSCRVLQDFSDVYINPLESISVDSPCFQIDSSSETPNKYPNAPQSSPIDIQNNRDISVFNEELIKCLSKLPVILLPSEESKKNGSLEIPVFQSEDHARSYLEPSNVTEPEIRSDTYKMFEGRYENVDESCSITNNYVTWNKSDHFEGDVKSGSTGHFPTNTSNHMEKLHLLRVHSVQDFNRDFRRRSTFSDNESIIANCASDVSDISLGEEEFASSTSRDRIKLEALALDSTIHSTIFHWKTFCRNKRALSLDEINPLKTLNTNDFSTTEFELTV